MEVCQNSQAVRPEGAAPHSPGQRPGLKDEHGPYALQGQKLNYYGVALLALASGKAESRAHCSIIYLNTQGVLALASGKAERPWAM